MDIPQLQRLWSCVLRGNFHLGPVQLEIVSQPSHQTPDYHIACGIVFALPSHQGQTEPFQISLIELKCHLKLQWLYSLKSLNLTQKNLRKPLYLMLVAGLPVL